MKKGILLLLMLFACIAVGCGDDNKKEETPQSAPKVETDMYTITIDGVAEDIKNGKVVVNVTTNLADGAEIIISLNQQYVWREKNGISNDAELNEEQGIRIGKEAYKGQSKQIVKDGKATATFSGDKLKAGEYDIEVSMSVPRFQSDKAKMSELYGEKGEKFKGEWIHTSGLGTAIFFEKRVNIK